jgi:hypothetical protein
MIIRSDCLPVHDQAVPRQFSDVRKKKRRGRIINDSDLTPVVRISRGSPTADVFIKGHPDSVNGEQAQEDEIVITLENGEQYSEDVTCLFCGAKV